MKKGDRVKSNRTGVHGTVETADRQPYLVHWDDGTKSRRLIGELTFIPPVEEEQVEADKRDLFENQLFNPGAANDLRTESPLDAEEARRDFEEDGYGGQGHLEEQEAERRGRKAEDRALPGTTTRMLIEAKASNMEDSVLETFKDHPPAFTDFSLYTSAYPAWREVVAEELKRRKK